MPTWVIATFGISFGVLATWRFVADLRRGISSSYVRVYHFDEEPVGYALCVASYMAIAALTFAMALHAFGLIGNPFDAINAVLPPFLRCPPDYYCGP
jgi:hypothetical protein